MKQCITWAGMDAHKKFICVAVLATGRKEFIEWKVVNNEREVRRLAKKLIKLASGGEVRCCYEAGPCGYALKRQLEKGGDIVCEVIAPSLIPVKPGDHIKTDKRDARKLAELFMAGLLTEVAPPTEEEEFVRDLCRCREAVRKDMNSARHRLSKFLLRHGYIYPNASAWTHAHEKWIKEIKLESPVGQATLDEYYHAVIHFGERHQNVKERLEEISKTDTYNEPVSWLRCFHGIDTITAISIVAELHGIERFQSPRELMSYLGLTPSEHSSVVTKRGGITKAGNTHVRRLVVESAHHYRKRPMVGKKLRERRKGQPNAIITIADKAHQRLHRRYRKLAERGKERNKVVTAVARELVGFLWAALSHKSEKAKCASRNA